MSIKTMLETKFWNEQAQQWEEGVLNTIAKAVTTTDGSDVQTKLDDIPVQIGNAITALQGGVGDGGNTLSKLYETITDIQSVLQSDEVDLDTVREIVTYIKTNRDDLTLLGTNKVDIGSIVNTLDTISTVEGKVLDARQGKILKDTIDSLSLSLSDIQDQIGDYVTQGELQNELQAVKPTISSNAPSNPVDGQIWFKPTGTIEV